MGKKIFILHHYLLFFAGLFAMVLHGCGSSDLDRPPCDETVPCQQPAPSAGRVTHRLSSVPDTLTITWKGKQTKVAEGEILLKLTQSPLRKAAFDSMGTLGATILKQPNKLNWMRIKIPATQKLDTTVIDNYRKLPGVLQVQPNFVNSDDAFIPDDLNNRQWALNNTGQVPANGTADADVDAPEAWGVTTGSSNVIIAILDSGIPMQNGQLSHPELDDPNKMILGPDYFGDGGGVRDERGHGTHVAGIAGAETDNNTGISGTCPDCKLMIIQLMDETGHFFDSDFQDAVMYAVNHNADIINLSGSGPESPTKEDAVIYAQNNNVLLVAAAGNDFGGAVGYPAAYAIDYNNVIAVSATDHDDEIASYSNVGPEVSLSAPGGFGGTENADDIWSTTPNYAVTLGTALNYDYLAGTSMAAPHVAGAAALKLARRTPRLPLDGPRLGWNALVHLFLVLAERAHLSRLELLHHDPITGSELHVSVVHGAVGLFNGLAEGRRAGSGFWNRRIRLCGESPQALDRVL